MFRNYLVIALRNLQRNKVFSFIHIAGLTIGLACCMLILLYAADELTFDRFQQQKDQLYRVTAHVHEEKNDMVVGASGMTQGPSFKRDIPEVRDFVRVMDNEATVRHAGESFQQNVTWADDNFFTVFSFPLLQGSPSDVLRDPHALVLTKDAAIKYFGTTDVIGKTLDLEIDDKFEPFTVTGVARNAPQNSSIRFEMVTAFKLREQRQPETSWFWLSYPTFLVLDQHADPRVVEAKMKNSFERNASKQLAEEALHGGHAPNWTWGLQAFGKMHLDKNISGTANGSDPLYAYILSGIAIFILLIACINFVNLTIAQSIRRSKEIGIRKVVGGERKQLIFQFLGESFVLCLIAFLLAIGLALLALPTFNELSGKSLSLGYLLNPWLLAAYIALFLVTGLVAGVYPALVLSGFDPVRSLYNRGVNASRNYLSKTLVVIQFSLATFLIIVTVFIYAQFNFLTHANLGYNDKNLVEVTVGRSGDQQLMEMFRTRFSKISGVRQLAPRMDGMWVTNSKANGNEIDATYEHIDENYLPLLEIPIVQGRNFSPDFPADSTMSVLVNEAYVAAAGWKQPVGEVINFINGNDANLRVVGVVKDYHAESLKAKIRPQVFSVNRTLPFGQFLIRVDADKAPAAIAAMEKVFRSLVPDHPFRYIFRDEANKRAYESEARWKRIITFSALIAIFIACIGLFGLATLAIRKRVKEIGIRKVLGASVLQISSMISGSFVKLVLIAFIIAVPLSWYAASQWLNGFAYRINVSGWVFLWVSLGVTLIAMLTVGFQALRASVANPVKSLRSE